MNEFYNRNVVEAALLAAGKPLTVAELGQLFDESNRPKVDDIRTTLEALAAEYSNRGLELKETAAGFRIQVRREFAGEISRLWPERPAKYSRALLETLALIAYRQPITRAEIEAVRGVAVNPNIVKTVIERNWVRVVGHRDVPGRPELLGTTREFLDYFGLRSLDELPPLAELKAMGDYNLQLDLPNAGALEAPKGEGEVEGVAGLLGSDVAVVEGVTEGGSDGTAAAAQDAISDSAATEHDAASGAPGDVVPDAVVDVSAATDDAGGDGVVGAAVTAIGDAGAHGFVTGDGVAGEVTAATGEAVHDAGAHGPVATGDGVASEVTAATGEAVHDAGAHGSAATGDGVVSDAVAASHDAVASADGHHAHAGDHDAMSHTAMDARDAISHAAGAHHEVVAGTHEPVAKADIDDDTEADRTLSDVEVMSSESQDALDDAAEDDVDDDELSADGHGSREMVAAPRDSDD
jgi:segregation and condensation protein B